MNFLISCFRLLVAFLRKLMRATQARSSRTDEGLFRSMKSKIGRVQKCVWEINDFVNNRLGNSGQTEEKFG